MSNVNRVVAAAVLADCFAVDPDRRIPIDGAEVQQRPLASPTPRGTSNVRRYHSRFASPTFFITPDRADSIGNGTRIWPSNVAGAASARGRIA